jgi:hypothetical protein
MMKINFSNIPILLFMFFSISFCSKDDESDNTSKCVAIEKGTKIMPLGASRVQGFPGIFESYRYELWKDLVDGAFEFDFVGTNIDLWEYESHKNYCFDNEHEGRSGWTAAQINANIDTWLKSVGDVDIVLFSSPGGNDALGGADFNGIVVNINAIIDKIQAYNPNITIIVEQLAPGKSSFMTNAYKLLFAQMKTVIAQIASSQTTSASKVIVVDMATGFTDDMLADDIHYNKAGAEFIAERYYNKLVPLLN